VGDPHVDLAQDGTGSLFLWLRNDFVLQSASYNIMAATPGVIKFTGATTYNADIFAGVDIGDRWNEPVAHGVVSADGQKIEGMTGVNVTAFGLAPATRPLDTRYDAVANAALFAKIDFMAMGPGGTTQLMLSEGMSLIVENSVSPPLTFGGGSITVEPSASPMIDVLGNAMSIANGDATPSLADHTDFGITYLNAILTRTFTVENPGDADLVLGAPTIPAGYSLVGGFPTTIGAGGSDTFELQIDTSSYGVKAGDVSFGTNVTGAETFSFSITGEVVIPEPSSLALAGLAVFGLVGLVRRRQK
jgi:hypothetical protein